MLFRTLLATLVVASLGLSPIYAVNPALAQSATTTLTGMASDGQGNGLGGVTIAAKGPATYVTTTNSDGRFEIDNVKPGIYTITATLGGYNGAEQDNFAVLAGTPATLNVQMIQQTLSSLQEIGHVRVNASTSTFNTTASAVSIVPQAQFTEQGALGLARVLEEQPGFTLQTSGAAGNTAGRAAYQVPSFRDGFVTETEDLLDGHSVGAGDNGATTLTTFLSPYILSSVELIAGPGATAPDIYSAINGPSNFHTLDPTSRPQGSITYGIDGYGGQSANFRLSGTTWHGKLGYVFDYVVDGSPGPLGLNGQEPLTIAAANTTLNGKTFTATTQTSFTNNIENNPPPASSTLLECCYTVSTQYLNRNELAKLVYHFSPNTSLSGSFIDDQLTASAIGNEYDSYSTLFSPGATYNPPANAPYMPGGIYVTGQQLAAAPVVPGAYLNRIQPNYQTEFRTGNTTNTFIARYWQAQYEFFITQGQSGMTPGTPYTTNLNLYGTATVGGVPTTFNGTPATFVISPTNPVCNGPTQGTYTAPAAGVPSDTCGTAANPTSNYATQTYPFTTQFDHMHGGTFEYDHFFPNTDYLTISYDQTQHAGYLTGYIPPVVPSVPDGAWLNTNTLLARGVLNFGKLNVTLSNYYDYYKERYSTNAGIPVPIPGCTINTNGVVGSSPPAGCSPVVPGAGLFSVYNNALTFQQSFVGHDDPRIGLTFRADPNLSLRFSTGSSLVPVYLSAINVTNTLPTAATTGLDFTATQANPNLQPETAWGYDLGSDWRLGDGQTVVSVELYQSNLRNQLFAAETLSCYTPATGVISAAGTGCTAPSGTVCTTVTLTTSCPLYTSENENFSQARYQGVQLSITHNPPVGFGFTINGSLMRGYPYNVNPCFYYTAPNPTCTGTLGATGAAIPVPTNTSAIGIIPGANFGPLGSAGIAGSPLTGMFTSAAAGAVAGPGAASGGDLGGFPYSTGFLDLHWRSAHGGLLQFTSSYFGPNNGYDMPAFARFDANAIFPIYDRNTTLTVNVINLGNIDSGDQIGEFEGISFPLENNRIGLSNLYPLGPRRIQMSLTHNFNWGGGH